MARITAARSRPRMTGTQRRAQLIGVARSLFALRGLEGATIEDIAAGAGVSKPVVYEHFGSKEALYTEVVNSEFDRLLAAVTEALGADAGPRVLLERAAYSLLDYIENHTDGFRILVRDAPPSQPEGTFSTLLSRIAADVEHILAKEFSSRGLSAEVGGMYAQMLVGMVAMTGQWWLDARSPDKATVAAHLVNLSWNGLTGLQKDPALGHIPGGIPGSLPGGAPMVLTLSAVLVHDGEGRILLVRKRGTQRFMQPGGKLEPGEDFRQAAAREVNEELGLRVEAADLSDIGHWYGPAANEANTFIDAGLFGLTLPGPFGSGADPVPQAAAEIEETLWLTPAEAFARTDISPLLRDHVLPELLAAEAGTPQ
ncbi:TetR family transcriptional regulator [Arthrobacter sp. Sa2BUA2]|uniref:TetR family transcriptional regulator n=1 Tax=Arthrobacter pullicola TaxID=2762224 RepID=A0ABR8YG39_9MICC|nr:NUDIX domain-containing protein [Arthrobacter pullicola]MBD8043103.1 TetR family transcriptional regulator [Arthrobacter pullicola]